MSLLLLYRGVRGPLQQRLLFGSGAELRPPAGHRWRGLQGEHLGCEQSQLHHGETTSSLQQLHLHHTALIFITVCVCVSQSLTGHKSPVECVQFNMSEEQVVAGSQSGSIRVWDLEAAKSEALCVSVCVCVCLCVSVCVCVCERVF